MEIKTIHRIIHANLPFSEAGIIGAFKAVSDVRGIDIGDGCKYRFIGIKNLKTENMKNGCKMKRKNEKGRIVSSKRKDAHFHQSFDLELEVLSPSPQSGIDDMK